MRYVLLTALAGVALTLAPSTTAVAQDGPVVYMTQYKIQAARMDSLAALTAKYDAPWHDFIAENVEGYQRWYFRHDTGNEYNYMIVTMYPNWDMIRGDEIPYDDLFSKFVASMGMTMEEADNQGVEEKFDWAYEGSQHMDQIWRPIEAEAMMHDG